MQSIKSLHAFKSRICYLVSMVKLIVVILLNSARYLDFMKIRNTLFEDCGKNNRQEYVDARIYHIMSCASLWYFREVCIMVNK